MRVAEFEFVDANQSGNGYTNLTLAQLLGYEPFV
jgi:hypothetical protein